MDFKLGFVDHEIDQFGKLSCYCLSNMNRTEVSSLFKKLTNQSDFTTNLMGIRLFKLTLAIL